VVPLSTYKSEFTVQFTIGLATEVAAISTIGFILIRGEKSGFAFSKVLICLEEVRYLEVDHMNAVFLFVIRT
jgi:hypothetical protein